MIYTVTLNPSIDYVFKTDDFQEGQLNHIYDELAFPGGKGINVARILNELGTQATNLGFIGGFTGDFIKQSLLEKQIAEKFTTIAAPTRINLKMKGVKETELNGRGPHITLEEVTRFLAELRKIQSDDLVIVSGSLPQSLPEDFYEQIIAIIKERQAEFVVDTSGEKLWRLLEQKPLLVKPNREELAELFNVNVIADADIPYFATQLLAKGAQHVIISLGGEGALLFSPEGNYQARAPKGQLVNSVGAGDSLVAGFVETLRQTKSVTEAFKMGIACGSATAFTSDLATMNQIEALKKQIVIEKI